MPPRSPPRFSAADPDRGYGASQEPRVPARPIRRLSSITGPSALGRHRAVYDGGGQPMAAPGFVHRTGKRTDGEAHTGQDEGGTHTIRRGPRFPEPPFARTGGTEPRGSREPNRDRETARSVRRRIHENEARHEGPRRGGRRRDRRHVRRFRRDGGDPVTDPLGVVKIPKGAPIHIGGYWTLSGPDVQPGSGPEARRGDRHGRPREHGGRASDQVLRPRTASATPRGRADRGHQARLEPQHRRRGRPRLLQRPAPPGGPDPLEGGDPQRGHLDHRHRR